MAAPTGGDAITFPPNLMSFARRPQPPTATSTASPDPSCELRHDPPSRPLAGLLRVSSLTIVSRVLGLVRDAAMATAFGNGPVLDAFTVAFRLPNVARRLFGEAAFSTAFLPIFVRELQQGHEAAWKLATAMLVVTAAAVTAVTLVVEAGIIIGWQFAAPGETRLLLELTAILFPYQIFICIAAQAVAVLHAYRRFTLPALLPIAGNIVWLAVLVAALGTWDSDSERIVAVAAGVVVAGFVQFALTIPALRAIGMRFRWDWPVAKPRVKEVALAVLPVLAGLAVTELNGLIDGLFAWLLTAPADAPDADPLRYPLPSGTAAALFLGQRLYQFPLGVFGVALGTVLFPLLARHAAAGRRDELRSDLTLGLQLSIAIGLPASVGLVLTARPLADALFRYGAFDAADAAQTSSAIAAYGVGVGAYIAMLIANRGFYAVGDRMTPLRTGIADTLLNIVMSVALTWPLGGMGLALATSIAASIQLLLSIIALRSSDLLPDLRLLGITALKATAATAAMAVVCVMLREGIVTGESPLQRMLAVAVPVVGSVVAYAVAAWTVGLREIRLLLPDRRGSTSSERD